MGQRRRPKRPEDWPEWFEPRRYPHFDQPTRTPDQVRWLVESPNECAKRAFLPFIRFEKTARKYKKECNADGSVSGGFKKKPRDLKYASHTDSQILRYYANLLSTGYEQLITTENFADCVLAYRRMRPPRCNIHFANDAFEWIERRFPCVALTFDVKDFFEPFDHKLLKRLWKAVLGVKELSPDHYNIFKAVTQYSWVNRDALFDKLGISRRRQKSWHGPVCTPEQFREIVRAEGLIHPRPGEKKRTTGVRATAL